MALASFEDRINDLIGSFIDENAMDTFLTDGLKELYSVLPPKKLSECTTTTTLSNSPQTLDLDTVTIGSVFSVTRKNSIGYNQICRFIPSMLSSRVTDPEDLLHATENDPVYFINNAVLNVYPDPTASQIADVVYLPLPNTVIGHDSSSIDNLPNELEYIVVLYAAIKCAQALLAEEEDLELYVPIIKTLKADYNQALALLGVKINQSSEPESGANQQALLNQMLEYGK
tara:strand:- start:325 stop:1011 length:687 start_codon:yes stop_codon:yes gene_type:complete